MNVKTQLSAGADEITISIEGRFDFTVQQDFRNAYRHHEDGLDRYRVNLAQAEYLDSSALGMLLLLREHAEKHRAEVIIERPSPEVRRILEIAHFNELFSIVT